MFSLSLFIRLHNGPRFAMVSICSCGSFRRNADVSVFNDCRLTTVRLVQFKNNHFELVARCLNLRKKTKTRKVSEVIQNNHLITLPVAAFHR